LPGGQLGIAIGDVSGKGIAAALTMASLQASLRGEATRAPEDLAALVSNVNRLVYEVPLPIATRLSSTPNTILRPASSPT